MPIKSFPVLPIIGGENSRLGDKSQGAFQVQKAPGSGYAPPKYLRALTDLLIASDGAVTTRPGRVESCVLDNPMSMTLYEGILYIHNGTQVVRCDPATGVVSVVASDVSPVQPVSWCEHQGLLRWTDGSRSRRLTKEGVLITDMPQAETPTVQLSSGSLPAGLYLASITWVDSTGLQSGCAESAVVEVPVSEDLFTYGITVNWGLPPADCVAVRLWCSRANEPPVFIDDYDPSAGSATVEDIPTSSISLRSVALEPLPPGKGLTVRGGFLVSWKDDLISFSAGDWTNHYDPELHIIQLPETILGAVGVEDGLWVSTPRGLYWVDGKDLTKAKLSPRKDSRVYASGSSLLPAELTGVQTQFPVAAFASTEGIVFGTGDGQVIAPTRESQKWDVEGKTVSFSVWEFLGEKYIMVGGI